MAQNKLNKKGRCLNIGNCPKANTKEIIEVGIGEDFVCPECGGQLVEVKETNVLPYVIGGVVVAALVVAGIVWGPQAINSFKTEEKTVVEPDTVEQVEQVTEAAPEQNMGHRTKRILRVGRKRRQTY